MFDMFDMFDISRTRVGRKFYMMMTYLLLVSKHCKTDWKSMWLRKGTMFKNISYLMTLHVSKFSRQHPTSHQLYGHLSPITKTIQVRQTKHVGHCWRSRDELISDVLLWTPTYDRAKAGRPVRTYIQQLCEDTGCSPEDLLEVMNDREKWQKRVRDIRAGGTTWWWWWWWHVSIFFSISTFQLTRIQGI